MQFIDDSLLPENQEPLVIQVAPYGPQFLARDSDDIPVSMADQVQKAVDCYNAGATVLHVHVREADGKGSKRLSMFNELLARLRDAVPKMILQVGGSISFAPEGNGEAAKWLSDDTRHMLADLDPKPDQVTIVVNSATMNITELHPKEEFEGTSIAEPAMFDAYKNMSYEAGPVFVEEHLKRLQAAGIQPHFMVGQIGKLESIERLIRRGIYKGPLLVNWVQLGGGSEGPNPRNLLEMVNRLPENAVFTVESFMRYVHPLTTMAIAMGFHARCGIEDTLWGRQGERMSSVQQVERMANISHSLYREVASAEDARRIYRIGEQYKTLDETLQKVGYLPNRGVKQRGQPSWVVA